MLGLSRRDPKKPVSPDTRAATARILRDLEALGRAVAASRNKPVASGDRPRSASTGKYPPTSNSIAHHKQKTPPPPPSHSASHNSSIWNWKPLRALSLIRRRRFHCRFTVRVHSVRGLSPALESRSLWVQWRKAGDRGESGGARTRAVMVTGGIANFDEAMAHRCFVYGAKGGHRSSARYEEKQFVLRASVVGEPEADLGNSRFDITRLLPLDLEEMDAEGCAGEWSTTFRLSGKAKGAVMSVSFGFSVLESRSELLGRNVPANGATAVSRSQPGNPDEVGSISPASGGPPDVRVKVTEKGPDLDGKEDDSMIEELAAALDELSIEPDKEDKDGGSERPSEHAEIKSSYKLGKITKSQSLDHFSLSLANESSSPPRDRSSDSEPESPRERLWRQFERESLGGCLLLSPCEEDLSSLVEAAETEHRKATQSIRSKARAKLLEDAETEALMREWGMDEKAFLCSPPPDVNSGDGFGSPIELPPPQHPHRPPLADGLGPSLRTADGGFLRTMCPSLLGRTGGLIMQASRPVVVPAEMGSGVTDIMQALASLGMETLSTQARNLMPLPDITGKTMQQVAREALSTPGNPDPVSLEELVASTEMEKIEALSLEGLRIQSGMCEEDDAPPAAGLLHLPDVEDPAHEVGGLMGLSLTLDEWMRLDSGKLDGNDVSDERTCRILAAHHAKYPDLVARGEKKSGLLGDNFTVAVMLHLRDPTRNYEPVGAPMLALIQVERVVSVKPRVSRNLSEDFRTSVPKSEEEEAVPGTPEFKMKQVHVGGVKAEPDRRDLWGNPSQVSSGSRWLLASGMGKKANDKHAIARPRTPTASSTTAAQPGGGILWSISSWIRGRGDDVAALNSHTRNANVIVPNQVMRRQ